DILSPALSKREGSDTGHSAKEMERTRSKWLKRDSGARTRMGVWTDLAAQSDKSSVNRQSFVTFLPLASTHVQAAALRRSGLASSVSRGRLAPLRPFLLRGFLPGCSTW